MLALYMRRVHFVLMSFRIILEVTLLPIASFCICVFVPFSN